MTDPSHPRRPQRHTWSIVATLIRADALNLLRDRAALALTFLLPIAFFSVFATVFASGGPGASTRPQMRVLVIDHDRDELATRLIEHLRADPSLELSFDGDASPSSDLELAKRVRGGEFDGIVVVPEGFSPAFMALETEATPLRLVYDETTSIVESALVGTLRHAVMSSAPDLALQAGTNWVQAQRADRAALAQGPPLPPPRAGAEPDRRSRGAPPPDQLFANDEELDEELDERPDVLAITTVASRSVDDEDAEHDPVDRPMTPYYAAGTAVMFLLFATAGAAGSLLDDRERGTLERILVSMASIDHLLLAHAMFFVAVGCAQVTVMFAWGACIFDLDMSHAHRLVGFCVMTVATSGVATGLALLMAVSCRSRAQLNGVSTIAILIMSALGGSMIPRHFAPILEASAPFTINGWALDGYLQVFWYDDPAGGVSQTLDAIASPVGVLVTIALVAFLLARHIACRDLEAHARAA